MNFITIVSSAFEAPYLILATYSLFSSISDFKWTAIRFQQMLQNYKQSVRAYSYSSNAVKNFYTSIFS